MRKTFGLMFLLVLCASAQTGSAAPSQTAPSGAPSAQGANATQSSAANSASPPLDENGRKAKTLIDQMIQALGGEAWLNVQTITEEGRAYSFYHDQPSGAGVVYWRFWKWPDKDRVELTKNRDWVILHTGDKGYELTFRGVTPEEQKKLDEYLRRRNNSLQYVLRRWLNEKGVALFYEGPSLAARKQTDRVTVLNSENEGVTIDIDTASHLPVSRTFVWRDPTDKQRNEEGTIYDNYKTIQGIATPMSITSTRNGDMINQSFITSVEYNREMPDSLFAATPENYKHK